MKIISCIFFTLYLICFMQTQTYSQQTAKKLKVAILIYDGVYLLDFCGPLEIFYDTFINDTMKAFEVYTVAPTKEKIKCHTGLEILPQYSIDTCPQPDILVIPGGNPKLVNSDKKMLKWIKETSEKTEITMSVCTGAFILAELGMLDGMKATTWYGALDRLQKVAPKAIVMKDKRFTDNRKIITTAGVSAGIDGALHIVNRYFGKEIAEKTAKYIEYNFSE
jgi:transcriptional regulator GlxA family with amidase domain